MYIKKKHNNRCNIKLSNMFKYDTNIQCTSINYQTLKILVKANNLMESYNMTIYTEYLHIKPNVYATLN